MTRRMQENAIAVLLLAVFVTMFVVSLGYGPRARLVPLPIAALGVALTLLQIIWHNFRTADELSVDMMELVAGKRAEEAKEAVEDKIKSEAPPQAPASKVAARKEAAAFAIVGGLLALCLVAGPLPALFVFMVAYLGLSHVCSWPAAVAWSLLGTGGLYLVFGRVLNVEFNRGLIAPLLSPYLHF